MSISGETIDYGPCAFMDTYDPKTVFSSIDREGRYAYGNQPNIAGWNLARFAETLLPLLDDNQDVAIKLAQDAISDFNTEFEHRGEKHYERLDEVFEEALIIIRDNNLKEKFEERINTMIESSTDWYGQQETLQERKNEYW